jgi:hypothetical protein
LERERGNCIYSTKSEGLNCTSGVLNVSAEINGTKAALSLCHLVPPNLHHLISTLRSPLFTTGDHQTAGTYWENTSYSGLNYNRHAYKYWTKPKYKHHTAGHSLYSQKTRVVRCKLHKRDQVTYWSGSDSFLRLLLGEQHYIKISYGPFADPSERAV